VSYAHIPNHPMAGMKRMDLPALRNDLLDHFAVHTCSTKQSISLRDQSEIFSEQEQLWAAVSTTNAMSSMAPSLIHD